jgi:isocitrate lyase
MATTNGTRPSPTAALAAEWTQSPRWEGIERPYTAEEVIRLRGRFVPEHTLARLGAERLWELLRSESYIPALGAVTGGQAVQMVRAGLRAIPPSRVLPTRLAGLTYPDQSLYPANSVPALVRRLNNALMRADQIDWSEGSDETYWLAPIVADAEAGFGGPLNAFELMKAMIEAGAGGVHFEDQLAAEKKCGHLGGKVLVPTSQFIRTLSAARLAADVLGVPTVLVARTDALSATLLTSDVDPADAVFVTGERTPEGFFRVRDGLDSVIARSLAYAPRGRALVRTSTPDLGERAVRGRDHERLPGKLLAWLLAVSWKRHSTTTRSQRSGAAHSEFQFQFIACRLPPSAQRVRAREDCATRDDGVRLRGVSSLSGGRLYGDAPPAGPVQATSTWSRRRRRRRVLDPRSAARPKRLSSAPRGVIAEHRGHPSARLRKGCFRATPGFVALFIVS